MKVCRVSQTSPTDKNNGKGLHCFHVSNLMKYPTLILTKNYRDENYWKYENHVELKRINYFQFPFPKENKLSYQFVLAILSYFIGQMTFFFKSISSLIKFKPNIVHLQSPHAILIGVFCKILFRSKIVITFHGSDLRRIKKNKIFLLILKCADRLLYVDENMDEELMNYYSQEVLVHTPSGIDIDFYTPLNLSRKKQVITVGNLRWQKDHETLIIAFSSLLKIYPDYKLVIIGEGEKRTKLTALAKSLGIIDNIVLYGRKTKEEVLRELNLSKFFVLSSVTEGMPKALIEALATDTPVVVTNVGSCSKLAEGAGYSVPPSDSESLAQAMIKMIANEEQYTEFSSQGRRNVEDLSWKSLANIVNKTFLDLEIR